MSELVAMPLSISSGGIIHSSAHYVNNTWTLNRSMLIFLLYPGKPMESADRVEWPFRSGVVDFHDARRVPSDSGILIKF